jgi:hypothetical protein
VTPALFGGCIRGPGGGSTLSASWSIRGCPQFPVRHSSTVGASLLANAQCQPTSMLNGPTSSRASRSHRVQGYTQIPTRHRSTVGAGLLANAQCRPTSILNGPTSSRASRIAAPPLPQGSRVSAISRPAQFNCGSGLAREGAVSANINAEWADVFASKSDRRTAAPTRFSLGHGSVAHPGPAPLVNRIGTHRVRCHTNTR